MHLLTVIQTPLTHYGAFRDIKVWRGRGELCHLVRDRGGTQESSPGELKLMIIWKISNKTSDVRPALKIENIPENDWDRTRYRYRRRGPNGY